jgi:hypothetical protein
MDVKSAFLNGDIKDEVCMHQPPGFVILGKEGKVLHLRKALYSLRQAPRAWNAKLDSTLKGMGFGQSPHEAATYWWGNGVNTLLVGVYVDDLVITDTKDAEVAAFKEEMKAAFQMSDLGLLSFYLGIEVHQGDSGFTLRQTAYAKHVVELAGLTDCNLATHDRSLSGLVSFCPAVGDVEVGLQEGNHGLLDDDSLLWECLHVFARSTNLRDALPHEGALVHRPTSGRP